MEHRSNSNLKKGDLVVTSVGFPGIVQDNYGNRTTRLLEVWGLEHEWGSEWADELKPVSKEEFEARKERLRPEWGKWDR